MKTSACFLISLLVGAAFIAACEKCGDDDYSPIFDHYVSFELFYAGTGRPVIGIFPDTSVVKVLDEQGKKPLFSQVDGSDGRVIIYYIDETVVNQPKQVPLRKIFYLQLSPIDVDTIAIDYELESNKCGSPQVKPESFRLFYNDSLQSKYPGGTQSLNLYK